MEFDSRATQGTDPAAKVEPAAQRRCTIETDSNQLPANLERLQYTLDQHFDLLRFRNGQLTEFKIRNDEYSAVITFLSSVLFFDGMKGILPEDRALTFDKKNALPGSYDCRPSWGVKINGFSDADSMAIELGNQGMSLAPRQISLLVAHLNYIFSGKPPADGAYRDANGAFEFRNGKFQEREPGTYFDDIQAIAIKKPMEEMLVANIGGYCGSNEQHPQRVLLAEALRANGSDVMDIELPLSVTPDHRQCVDWMKRMILRGHFDCLVLHSYSSRVIQDVADELCRDNPDFMKNPPLKKVILLLPALGEAVPTMYPVLADAYPSAGKENHWISSNLHRLCKEPPVVLVAPDDPNFPEREVHAAMEKNPELTWIQVPRDVGHFNLRTRPVVAETIAPVIATAIVESDGASRAVNPTIFQDQVRAREIKSHH